MRLYDAQVLVIINEFSQFEGVKQKLNQISPESTRTIDFISAGVG